MMKIEPKTFTASNGIIVRDTASFISFWRPDRSAPSSYLTKEMIVGLLEYLKQRDHEEEGD